MDTSLFKTSLLSCSIGRRLFRQELCPVAMPQDFREMLMQAGLAYQVDLGLGLS